MRDAFGEKVFARDFGSLQEAVDYACANDVSTVAFPRDAGGYHIDNLGHDIHVRREYPLESRLRWLYSLALVLTLAEFARVLPERLRCAWLALNGTPFFIIQGCRIDMHGDAPAIALNGLESAIVRGCYIHKHKSAEPPARAATVSAAITLNVPHGATLAG